MKKQPAVEKRSTSISRNTPKTLRYFFHPDHIGSTSWVTDSAKNGIQYCEYLPYGEPFLDQPSPLSTPATPSPPKKKISKPAIPILEPATTPPT